MNPSEDTAPPPGETVPDELHAPRRIEEILLYAIVAVPSLVYSVQFTSFLEVKDAAYFVLLAMLGILAARRPLSWRGYYLLMPLWALLAFQIIWHLGIDTSRVSSETIWVVVRSGLLLALAVLAAGLLKSEASRNGLAVTIIGLAVLASLFALLQLSGYGNVLFPVQFGYSDPMYSVFGNRDLLGGFIAVALALLTVRLFDEDHPIWLSLAPFIVLVVTLWLTGSRTAWLAALAGFIASFPYRTVSPRRVFIAGNLVVIVSLIVIYFRPDLTLQRALGTFGGADVGGNIRLWIWAGAIEMIRSAPIVGVGWGNFGYWSPLYLGSALHAPGGSDLQHNEIHTLYAHSGILQTWAESGVIGLACIIWLVVILVRCRGPEWGGLVALGVFALFNPVFHSTPHAVTGILLATTLLTQRADRGEMNEPQTPLITPTAKALLAAGIAIAAIFGIWAKTLPSYYLRAAEDAHLAGEDALQLYARAVAHPWPDGLAREEYGIALYEQRRLDEAYRQFRLAFQTRDSGRMHLAMALIADERHAQSRARQWAQGCLWRWPSNAAAWELLLRNTHPDERTQYEDDIDQWLPEDDARYLRETYLGLL